MIDRLERVIDAWSKSPQANKELTARRLLAVSKGDLRKALNQTRQGSQATTPRALGNWLSNNADTLALGYYIRWRLDTKRKTLIWRLEKASDDELRRIAYEDVKREAMKPATAEQIANPVCFALIPNGAARFSHEPTARACQQQAQALGVKCDVIFHRSGGHAVRLFDVGRDEAETLAKRVLRRVEQITAPIKQESGQTIIESTTRTDSVSDTLFSRGVPDVPRQSQGSAVRSWNAMASFGVFNDSMPSRPMLLESSRKSSDAVLSHGFWPNGTYHGPRRR